LKIILELLVPLLDVIYFSFPLLFYCIISLMYIDIYWIICIRYCIKAVYQCIILLFRCVIYLMIVISSGESDLNGRIYDIRIRFEVWMSIFERAKFETLQKQYESCTVLVVKPAI
jgi:hypothetical protein